MTAGRFSKLAVTLLCGTLMAGCGSSNSSTTTSTPTTTPAKTSSASATTPTKASKSSTSTSTSTATTKPTQPTAPTAAEYGDLCKSIITHEPALEASLKIKLEGICSKAANGDLAGAREAAKQVCVEVIKSTPIPAADKEKALAACKES